MQIFIWGGRAPVLSSLIHFYASVELTKLYFTEVKWQEIYKIQKETLTFINFFLRFVYDFVYHGSD